jgi:hypothetical protein
LYYYVRADKPPNGGIVVSCIVIVQTGGVKALAGKAYGGKGLWVGMVTIALVSLKGKYLTSFIKLSLFCYNLLENQ